MRILKALRPIGVVLVFMSLSGAPANADAGDSFGGYQAAASGSGFSAAPILPSLLPAEAPFEGTLSLATASLSTGGNGFGRASTLWPGSLFVGIRPLLEIGAGVRLPLPDYPLVVEQKEYEDAKHSEQPGITMATDVKPEHANARAEDGGFSIPAIISVGSIRTVSDVVLETKKVSSVATSTINGVDVTGGLHIDSIESTAATASDSASATCAGGVAVSGANVGGVPVIIDDSGVHAQGQSLIPGVSPNDAVAAALAASGVEVRTLSGADGCDGALANRTTGGLLISVPLPAINPVPPGGKLLILLGSTSANAGASPAFNLKSPLTTTTKPPSLAQVVTHAPGPASGGVLSARTQTSAPNSPPPAQIATTPVESISYRFKGVPAALVVGLLLLAAVPGSRFIRRYMQRLFAAVASP